MGYGVEVKRLPRKSKAFWLEINGNKKEDLQKLFTQHLKGENNSSTAVIKAISCGEPVVLGDVSNDVQ